MPIYYIFSFFPTKEPLWEALNFNKKKFINMQA